jgi:hypothetical protein
LVKILGIAYPVAGGVSQLSKAGINGGAGKKWAYGIVHGAGNSKTSVPKILDTPKAFTTPPAAQTKPGLLSYQSFNQKNHPADNTLNHCLPPTKKARQLPWAVFLLAS